MNVTSSATSTNTSSTDKYCKRTIDLIKILPSVGWLIMCLVAIPSYSSISWKTPVICAVLSSIISIIATYDMFRFHRRYKYLVFGNAMTSQKSKFAEIKFCFGCTFAMTSLCLCIAFLSVGYSIPPPVIAKDGCSYGNFRRPAPNYANSVCATCSKESRGTDLKLCVTKIPDGIGGSCNKTCTEIRDAYVSNIKTIYPAAINLCPAPPDSANTFVSFSCLADGFWMLVTCIITLIWVVSLWILRKRSSQDMISIGPALAPLFKKNVAADALSKIPRVA